MTSREFVRESSDPAPRPQFVMDLDPFSTSDLNRRKTVLAMQALRLSVDEDPGFHEANERLHVAAATVDRPPTVTYEDMIFVNPALASEGSFVMLRESEEGARIVDLEAKFYQAHRRIEQQTYSAIGALLGEEAYEQWTSDPDNPYAVKIDFDTLGSPVDHLHEVNRLTAALYQGMSRDEFDRLRTVFGGLNGHDGPSGLHSSSIPLLDFLIHGGDNVRQGDRQRMMQPSRTNPHPAGQPFDLLLQAALDGQPVQLDLDAKLREDLIRKMNNFRKIHLVSVRELLPDVFNNEADGTGGISEVRTYLEGKQVNHQVFGKE